MLFGLLIIFLLLNNLIALLELINDFFKFTEFNELLDFDIFELLIRLSE